MANEKEVGEWMKALRIADKHTIGDIGAAKLGHKEGASAVNQAYKSLCNLLDSELEKGDGYFRVKGCRSEYGEHARLITKAIADLIKLPVTVHVRREHEIKEVGLRPDALFIVERDGKGIAGYLEVRRSEVKAYLDMKRNAFKSFDTSKYFQELFGWEKVDTVYFLVEPPDLTNLVKWIKEQS